MTPSNPKTHRAPLVAPSRRDVLRYGTATAVAASLPGIAQARAKTLRFAHPAPTSHGWHRWAEAFKSAIEEKTAGGVTVQIFPDAQMGNERDTAQSVRLGSLDMGAIGVGLMNWVPEMSVTDGPFLWQSRDQAHAAFAGDFGAELKRRALDKGFKLVGWTDLGFRCMTNNVKEITAASDMSGMKMRVPNSRAYIALMQSLGATTVAVDLSELYLALRQGVADGQDTPPSVVKSNKLFEVQKFVSKTDHVLTTAYVVVNPASFDKLAPDEQAAFLEASAEADAFLRDFTQTDEEAAYDFLAEKGMTVTTEVDGDSFRAATASVLADNPDLFPPDLVAMAQATQV